MLLKLRFGGERGVLVSPRGWRIGNVRGYLMRRTDREYVPGHGEEVLVGGRPS